MRWSQTLIPTQKETPADAVAPSHILLLRAGMIRPLGAGAYTFLPLGYRVLRKASQIVREEMDAAGAIELHMPALQPIEIWEESGRDQTMRGILMRFKLGERHEFTLGPTHEEVMTDLARDIFKSYKQLPITLYQIQTKFRNEPRPRFGLLRTREFLMKDAYSFDADIAQLNESYDKMYEAYCRVFDRCGLPYVAVEAESGPIGGDASHEFMVPSATGEDHVIHCESCGYAANREKAEIGPLPAPPAPPADALPYKPVPTPGKKTIEEVTSFLKTKPEKSGKLLVFMADGKAVAVLVRGDHEANEAKVRRAFQATSLEPATAEEIEKATGAPMGFLGPVNCAIPLAIDPAVAALPKVVVGGNEVDVHFVGVVPGRDFPLTNVLDLRNAGAGDPCPKCGKPLVVNQGIEIGHVFKLGTKYSKAMGANYLDEKGQEHSIIMGCYGIGVSRILSAVGEACHDKDGLIWPLSLAPYDVLVVPLLPNNPEIMAAANRIVKNLEDHGVEVLVDDRDQRPGVKFKDADLIGLPLRVVVGDRGLKEGTIEVKWRNDPAPHTVPLASAPAMILEEIVARRQAEKDRCAERVATRTAARGKTS